MRKNTKKAFSLSIIAFSVMNAQALPSSATGGTNSVTVSGTGTSRTITVGAPNSNYTNVHVAKFDNFNIASGETVTISGTSANTANKRLVFIDNQGAATSINGTLTNSSYADLMLINKHGINVGATGVIGSAYNNKTMLIAGDVTNFDNINPLGGGDANVAITFNPSTDAGVTIAANALFKYDMTANSVDYASAANWNSGNTVLTTDGIVQGAFQTGGTMNYDGSAVFTNIKAKRQYINTGIAIQPLTINAVNDLTFTNYTWDTLTNTGNNTFSTTNGNIYLNDVLMVGNGLRVFNTPGDIIGNGNVKLAKINMNADDVSGLSYFVGNLTANTLSNTTNSVSLGLTLDVGTLSNTTLASSNSFINGTIGNSNNNNYSGGIYLINGDSVNDTFTNTWGTNNETVMGNSVNTILKAGTATVWGTTTNLTHTNGTFNGKGAVVGGTMAAGTETNTGLTSNRAFNGGTAITLNGGSEYNTFKANATIKNGSSYDVFNGSAKTFTVNGDIDHATLTAGTLTLTGNLSYSALNSGILSPFTGNSDHNTYGVNTTITGTSTNDILNSGRTLTVNGNVDGLTANNGNVVAKANLTNSTVLLGNVTVNGNSAYNMYDGIGSVTVAGSSSFDTLDGLYNTTYHIRNITLGDADHLTVANMWPSANSDSFKVASLRDSNIYADSHVLVLGDAYNNTVDGQVIDGQVVAYGSISVNGHATNNTINKGGELYLNSSSTGSTGNVINGGELDSSFTGAVSDGDTFINAKHVNVEGVLKNATATWGGDGYEYDSHDTFRAINAEAITINGVGNISISQLKNSSISNTASLWVGASTDNVFTNNYNSSIGSNATINTGNVFDNTKGIMAGTSTGNRYINDTYLQSTGDSIDDVFDNGRGSFDLDVTRATVSNGGAVASGQTLRDSTATNESALQGYTTINNMVTDGSVFVSNISTNDKNINGKWTYIYESADNLTVEGGEFSARGATVQNSHISHVIASRHGYNEAMADSKSEYNTVKNSINNIYNDVHGFEVYNSDADTFTNSDLLVAHDVKNGVFTDTNIDVFFGYSARLHDSVMNGGVLTMQSLEKKTWDDWYGWIPSGEFYRGTVDHMTFNNSQVTAHALSDSTVNAGRVTLTNSTNNRFDNANIELTSTTGDTFLNGALLAHGNQSGLLTQGTIVTVQGDLNNSVMNDGTVSVSGQATGNTFHAIATVAGDSQSNVYDRGGNVGGISTNDTFTSGTYQVHGATSGLHADNAIITFDDAVRDSVLNQVQATFANSAFTNNTVTQSGSMTFTHGASWNNSTASGDNLAIAITGDWLMDAGSRVNMTLLGDMRASTITTDAGSSVYAANLALDTSKDSIGNINDSQGTPGQSTVANMGVTVSGNVLLSNGSHVCWNGVCDAASTIIGPSAIVIPPVVTEPETPVVVEPPVVTEPEPPVVVEPPVVTEPEPPVVVEPPVTEPEPPVVVEPPVTEPEPPVVVEPPVTEPEPPVVVEPPVTEPEPPVVVVPPVTEPEPPVVVTPPTLRDVVVEMAQDITIPVSQVVVTTRVNETTAMSNGIYIAQPVKSVETPSVIETFNNDEQ